MRALVLLGSFLTVTLGQAAAALPVRAQTAPAPRPIMSAEEFVRRIRAGDSKSEIERRLVRDFGPAILAQPPKRGFDLLAWLLPIGGLLIGAVAVGFAAWRWTRSREPEPALAAAGPLDPALERRLDDELRRFDE